jgi:hypothetical protein
MRKRYMGVSDDNDVEDMSGCAKSEVQYASLGSEDRVCD